MPQIRDITVQEIDDFITENNLDPKDKFMFRILRNNYINGECAVKHAEDKDLHTPKGLLVRKAVVGWFIFLVIIISTIVTYLPEQIRILFP